MNSEEHINDQLQKKFFLKRFFTSLIPLSIVLAGILSVFYFYRVGNERKGIEMQAEQSIAMQRNAVLQDLKSIRADILILADRHELQEVINGIDAKKYLTQEFWSFSQRKRIYDQVRFLNETGMEVVRVNFNEGDPSIVSDDQLQNKANRYYFVDAFKLSREQIYVSPFDLNIEYGEIEKPLKPMIRFGTPVFDANGEKRGIVLVNYLGKNLLNDFKDKATSPFIHPLFVNKEGFFLKAINAEDEWAFMYADRKDRTCRAVFPDAWPSISQSDQGRLETKKGLFVFSTVYPLREMLKVHTRRIAIEGHQVALDVQEYAWKMIVHIPAAHFREGSQRAMHELMFLYVILLGMIGTASWLFALANMRSKEAQRKLQEAVDMRLNFLSVMTHELRTPLVVMNEGISLVLDGIVGVINPKQKDLLNAVKKNISRLNQLTTDVLDFQKGVAGKLQLKMDLYNMNTVIGEIQKLTEEAMKKKGLQYIVKLEEALPNNIFDKNKIIQVITNITNNAMKFTEKGSITIATAQGDNFIRVSISDTGPGIARDELPKLFQDFYQTSLVREKNMGGTGLGLAISSAIIQGHKGKIWAESELGKGMTFHFILPTIERRK